MSTSRVMEWMAVGLGVLSLCMGGVAWAAGQPHPAAAFRAKGEPVVPGPDGSIFCEAEEFKVEKPSEAGKPGWAAGYWGANYYAATFANTFLSRKAFLGAPEDCDETVATIAVDVKEAGRYLVLARYEAAYRFETQFRVKVEQGGQAKLDRLYGARDNLKIWAFSQKLQKEFAWYWGAVENIVWEGHDAYADLQAGPAKISLVAGKQPAPQAKRNIDVVLLTRDEAQVKERIEKEGYLPLDGMLTQGNDVCLKIRNGGAAKITVNSSATEHSPYWQHIRKWKPFAAAVEPGAESDWLPVENMDSMNDGQWNIGSSGPCTITFGVRRADGTVESVRTLECPGKLELVYRGDMRYSRRAETRQEVLTEYVAALKRLAPERGKTPVLTPIYFGSGVPEFAALYGHAGNDRKYTDIRSKKVEQFEEELAKLPEKDREAERNSYFVVSLGDEIGLPEPNAAAAGEGFAAFLRAQGVGAAEVDPASGGDWAKIVYNADPGLRDRNPGLYYWSKRFLYHYGIQEQKKTTARVRAAWPKAHVGANFSPHHGAAVHGFLGEVFKWVTCFRDDGMTLPWAEDYAWQLPIGTPQMNGINLDLFRAGTRGKTGRHILYYVMPHYPGNTPAMWRRMFFNALGHGMTIVDLFEFHPVWMAYTENHVTSPAMHGMVLRTFRELGIYEDIVQTGRRQPARVGLWFSETADIWGDYEGPFAGGKRGLYVAILNRQVPLDFIVEQDAADGTLKQYEALYLTDRHVSRAASKKIAEWVREGGRLFVTAGAAMCDEYNQTNQALRELLGVEETALQAPPESAVGFIKQDLPFARPVDEVRWSIGGEATNTAAFPVFGAVSRVKLTAEAKPQGVFRDGTPAVLTRPNGKGQVTYCAFLPALSYFRPAIPLKPLDRGSTDDAMAHFIPTAFDRTVGALVGVPVQDMVRPVAADDPLVETSVIESPKGTAIVLANWSGKALPGMKLTVRLPVPGKAELASGGKVQSATNGDATVYTFDMDPSGDVLILR